MQNKNFIFFILKNICPHLFPAVKDLPMECVQLYEEVIEGDSTDEVPSDMIQINANMQEVCIATVKNGSNIHFDKLISNILVLAHRSIEEYPHSSTGNENKST